MSRPGTGGSGPLRPIPAAAEEGSHLSLPASIRSLNLDGDQGQEQPGQTEQVRRQDGIGHQRSLPRQDRSQRQEGRSREKNRHQQPPAGTGKTIHPAQFCGPEKLDHQTPKKPAGQSHHEKDENEAHQQPRSIIHTNQGARDRNLIAERQPPAQGQKAADQKEAGQASRRSKKNSEHTSDGDSNIQYVQDHVPERQFNTWEGRDILLC